MHRIYGTGKKGGLRGGGAFLNFDGRQFHAALHNFSGQTRLCSSGEGEGAFLFKQGQAPNKISDPLMNSGEKVSKLSCKSAFFLYFAPKSCVRFCE